MCVILEQVWGSMIPLISSPQHYRSPDRNTGVHTNLWLHDWCFFLLFSFFCSLRLWCCQLQLSLDSQALLRFPDSLQKMRAVTLFSLLLSLSLSLMIFPTMSCQCSSASVHPCAQKEATCGCTRARKVKLGVICHCVKAHTNKCAAGVAAIRYQEVVSVCRCGFIYLSIHLSPLIPVERGSAHSGAGLQRLVGWSSQRHGMCGRRAGLLDVASCEGDGDGYCLLHRRCLASCVLPELSWWPRTMTKQFWFWLKFEQSFKWK